MNILQRISNLFSPKKTPPKIEYKQTKTQGYEDFRYFLDWSGFSRNGDIIPFDDYVESQKKHPDVYTCIKILVDNILNNGYEVVECVDNPKNSNKLALEEYLKNVDANGVLSFYEKMYSSIWDCLRDGLKIIQVDKSYPYLYDDLEIKTLRPNLKGNGLFDDEYMWEQIVDGMTTAKLTKDEIIWLQLPDRTELIYAQSPLQCLLLDIQTDLYGKQFNSNRFTNDSMFGMVINLDDDSTQEQAKKMLEHIRDNHIARQKEKFGELTEESYKPIVMYDGAKIDSTIRETFKDIQFVELKKVTKEAVFQVYGVPMVMASTESGGLGQAGVSKEALNRFYQTTIHPLQKLFEEQINKQLIQNRLNIYDWKIQFVRPISTNPDMEAKNRIDLVNAKIMLPIEAREGLRKFYPEMLEENDTLEMEETQETESNNNDNNNDGQESESNRAYEVETTIEETRATKTTPRKDFDTRAVKMSLDTAEEILKSDIAETMSKIMKSVKRDMIALADKKDYTGIQNYNFKYKNELESAFTKSAKTLFNDGTKFVNKQINQRADFGSSLADYLRMAIVKAKIDSEKYILDLSGKIKVLVTEAISKKKSNNEIIGVIETAFQEKAIATPTVVRTVSTNFYNMGVDRQIQQVKEFVPMVQFSAILDDSTTERCNKLDGKIFAVDSADFETLRPPLHFNCRSVIIPVTKLDIENNPELGIPTKSKELKTILTNTPGFEVI